MTMHREGEGEYYKFLTVEQLSDVLKSVPAGARLIPNAVGNMLVVMPDGVSTGYIDFLFNGEYVEWNDENRA